jgi:hypothetical protein
MAFKLILILAWTFEIYKHRIFQYKKLYNLGGQRNSWRLNLLLLFVRSLSLYCDGVKKKDFIFKTIFIFHDGDKLRNDCVTPLDCVFLIEALFFGYFQGQIPS